MKLISANVRDFRSVDESGNIEIGDITCLVGKNEAGKTALLQALYGLKPFKPYKYDKTRDYPRRKLSRFDANHPNGESTIVDTEWSLDDVEVAAINELFGSDILASSSISISSGFGFKRHWAVNINEDVHIAHLISSHKLNAAEMSGLKGETTTSGLASNIENIDEATPKQLAILEKISSYRDNRVYLAIIDELATYLPSFFYTSHYNRMSGEISLDQLVSDKAEDSVSAGDQIFLDFLEYAGTDIEELNNIDKHEDLIAQCEAASADITDEIFSFWSQNDALQVQITLAEGRAQDPEPFDQGTVAKIRILNTHHRASIPLSERSAGFVWFFSFLSQFKQLQETAGNAIILLDEPGLTLHGKAQSDLLKYIEERLLPNHQVIYSTHSPFLIPKNLGNVQIVEDVMRKDERGRPLVIGTKVSSDVLSVDKDTVFPLQAHLGYDITQSLFVGENTLLLEGPSDILYIQALSHELRRRSMEHLNETWKLCPTGGIDKVQSFASLFSGNSINIAVFTDYSKRDRQKIEKLKEAQILNSDQFYTVADFIDQEEGDIEDLFGQELFAEIVNLTYGLSDGDNALTSIKMSEADKSSRVVKQVEALFRLMPQEINDFDHFTPSSWLIRNPSFLESDSSETLEVLERASQIFSVFNKMLK